MTNSKSLLRVAGTACSMLISFEALELMTIYSEVRDDGLKSLGHTLFGDVLLGIAPFGPTSFLASILVGVWFWILSLESPPSPQSLIFPAGLAAMGWVACAVAGDLYKQFIYLDGGRTPTAGMWIANSLLIVGLAIGIYRTWNSTKSKRTAS